ncbi:hypothetical protein WN944_020552 [Citrus x changshan-huyou]|uniref:Uncharacterized protein n=1 Tax=Citrus x changshan-huyou TaxID=2935761 RepID=A0AAP0LYS7_9ROSI
MKFGKEFAAQMVPEWQEAYMDYEYLKALLKEIQRFKRRNRAAAAPGGVGAGAASTAELTISTPAGARTSRRDQHMDVIKESIHGLSDETSDDSNDINKECNHTMIKLQNAVQEKIPPLELGNHFKKCSKILHENGIQFLSWQLYEVSKLMEGVETTFVKHFSNSNRSEGMNVLRPKAKRERHRITFPTGFLSGRTAAPVTAVILSIRAHDLLNKVGQKQYMDNMFPLYSLFAFIVLHMLMYASNIYFWRRYRVNYSFIFGFKQGTELGYRQVLLVSFGISVLALLTVLGNLDMEIDPKTKDYNELREALPLILLVLLFAMLFLPFIILYRSSRFFFLTCLFHCIAVPLYKTSSVYQTFNFIVAVIPHTSRLLQCLRLLFEEKDPMQGYNGLKYFLTIVAVCMRTALILNGVGGLGWKIIAWIFSDLSALLRFAWLQNVLNFNFTFLHRNAMITIVASLEIIRRSIWNFFRLENEHLSNVGKYRAFKSVPLPFNDDEDEGER